MADGILGGLLGGSDEKEPEGEVVRVQLKDLLGELRKHKEETTDEDEDEIETLQEAREGEEGQEDEEETGGEEEEELPYEEALIYRPTDEQIIESAFERIQKEGAKEVRRTKVGVVEEPGEHIDNPQILLDDFDSILQSLHDELFERLKHEKQNVDEGFRHLGDEDVGHGHEGETFAYVIANTDKGFLVGGASNIIDNIANHMDVNEVEREFIRLAYDEAIRSSKGLEDITAHLILDDIIMVFDPDEVGPHDTEQAAQESDE